MFFKGLTIDNLDINHYSNKIIYYSSDSEIINENEFAKIKYIGVNNIINSKWYIDYKNYDNNISSMTIPNNIDTVGVKYIRICCHKDDIKNPVISTKEITCLTTGYLTDTVQVKEKSINKQTAINKDSSDDQIPSAKAVYNLLETALGEYVTDVADLIGGDA